MRLNELQNRFEQLHGRMREVEDDLQTVDKKIRQLNKKALYLRKAKTIVNDVAIQTQQQLTFHIGEIATMAMQSVLENPYKLRVNFVERRGKTECDLMYERNRLVIKPIKNSGGGALDIGAFALRIATWNMMKDKSMNVFLLDEPFKHLKGNDTNIKALNMVKEVCNKVGVQVVMISDERVNVETNIENADKLFVFRKKGKTTKIKSYEKTRN